MKSAYEKMKKINEKLKIATSITFIPKSQNEDVEVSDMDTKVCDF